MGFSDQQLDIIARPGSFFVDACPGAGKAHTIVERFIKRAHARDRRGIALISFTRAAADEVIARTVASPHLQQSPNFIGTIDTFVNRYITGPAVAARTGRRPIFKDAWSSLPSTTISVNASGGPPIELPLDHFSFAVDGSATLNIQRVFYRDRDRLVGLAPAKLEEICARASGLWQKLISDGRARIGWVWGTLTTRRPTMSRQ